MQLALCSYCCLTGQAHILACVHPFHSEICRNEKIHEFPPHDKEKRVEQKNKKAIFQNP